MELQVAQLIDTLAYFDRFSYPLTARELWFWQSGRLSLSQTSLLLGSYPHTSSDFYFLSGKQNFVTLRHQRLIFSLAKKNLAKNITRFICLLPWIQAVFITGALAMDNSPPDDDIDLFIITSPHTVWIVRFLLVITLFIFSRRRPSLVYEHCSSQVNDKICDNLYLDIKHLAISHNPADYERSTYLAHEILQAKCIFDRGGVYHQFLIQNSWVRNYLPIAYSETLKNYSNDQLIKLTVNCQLSIVKSLLWLINLLLFLVQYLYMRPKITTEKIGLGYAFFHPDLPRKVNPS